MPEILVQGHRGIKAQATYPYTEKSDPTFAILAQDVCFDLENTLYVAKGFGGLPSNAVTTNPANCTSLYYSYVYDALMFCESGNLTICSCTTGAQIQVLTGAFNSGVILSYIDWPNTGKVYISDGNVYKRLDLSGGTYALTTISGPGSTGSNFAAGKWIFIWRQRVWAAEAPDSGPCMCVPSNSQDPETFNSVNAIRLVEDGPNFNAATGNDNVMFIHKLDTILAVVGDVALGTLDLRNLATGRGAIAKTAVYTFEGVDYFIGKDGLYRFNGSTIDPIHKNIVFYVGGQMDTMGNNPGTNGTITANGFNYVVPFIPLWLPDYGRRYILFALQLGSTPVPQVFRWDVDSEDWVTLFQNNAVTLESVCYSSLRTHTYILQLETKQLSTFMDTPTYNGATITGIYETAQLTGGSWWNEKQFQFIQLFPTITVAQIYVDINAMGVYPYQLTDGNMNMPAQKTGLSLDRFSTAYMMSVKFVCQGGGKLISAGFAVWAEPEEDRPVRDYYQSRASVQNTWAYQFPSNAGTGSGQNVGYGFYPGPCVSS